MDQQEALQAYCAALSQEREQYLYQQAVKKSGAATRGMNAAERDKYLDSQAFQSTLYHLKRADSIPGPAPGRTDAGIPAGGI